MWRVCVREQGSDQCVGRAHTRRRREPAGVECMTLGLGSRPRGTLSGHWFTGCTSRLLRRQYPLPCLEPFAP